MRLVNLTAHAVTVYSDGRPLITFPPSGQVARITERIVNGRTMEVPRDRGPDQIIKEAPTRDNTYADVPVASLRLAGREVTGLPDEGPHQKLVNGPHDAYDMGPGLGYIVSRLVAEALPGREDLFCPGREIRDDAGRITGCDGLYAVQP